jgi:hypothetical protein
MVAARSENTKRRNKMKKRTIGAVAGIALLMAVVPFASAITQDDIILYRGAGSWFGEQSGAGGFGDGTVVDTSLTGFGNTGATAMVGDINGDGVDDVVVAQDSSGGYQWVAAHSTTDGSGNVVMSSATTSFNGNFGLVDGNAGNRLADIDGDGIKDIVTVNSDYTWHTTLSTTTGISTGAYQNKQFGLGGDHIISGDFNGDGMSDIGVWRAGATYVNLTSGGVMGAGATLTGGIGDNSWEMTLVGDINGDGMDDLMLVDNNDSHVADGQLSWIAAYGSASGLLDFTNGGGNSGFGYFGLNTDVPMLADINGDGKDDLVVTRDNGQGGMEFYSAYTDVSGALQGAVGVDSSTTFGFNTDQVVFGQLNVIPEPAALGMLLLGGGVLWVRKRLMI